MLIPIEFAVVYVDTDEAITFVTYTNPLVAVVAAICNLKANADVFGVDGIFPVVDIDMGRAIEAVPGTHDYTLV